MYVLTNLSLDQAHLSGQAAAQARLVELIRLSEMGVCELPQGNHR